MVAALVRFSIDYDGSGTWNTVGERAIGGVSIREGRNVATLGGPDIPSLCSVATVNLNNVDGFYTTGGGSALGPGARLRIQWRKVTTDAWETRFIGGLSEIALQFEGFSFFQCRFAGPLYRFTSGNIPGRLIINQTPQSIMTVLCDAAGVPAADRDFDTSTDEWNRELAAGYAGVQQVQAMVDGFIHDTPDGKVRLELPATRTAKTVVARYTDDDPDATEIGVPPPRRLTRPFGIINHVDGEYHFYQPATTTAITPVITLPQTTYNGIGVLAWSEHTVTVPLGFTPSPDIMITDWSIRIRDVATFDGVDVDHPAIDAADTVNGVRVRRLAITVSGTSLVISFELRRFNNASATFRLSNRSTVTVADNNAIDQAITVFEQSQCDGSSIERYGYRPRPTPLVIGLYQATPLAADFAPDYADLDAAMQQELDFYAEPIPVFAIERQSASVAERDDIMARRLSDKVHLTADGPSMLGSDIDCFVEAIETVIRPTGELRQTLWIEEA